MLAKACTNVLHSMFYLNKYKFVCFYIRVCECFSFLKISYVIALKIQLYFSIFWCHIFHLQYTPSTLLFYLFVTLPPNSENLLKLSLIKCSKIDLIIDKLQLINKSNVAQKFFIFFFFCLSFFLLLIYTQWLCSEK